nr:hypothetical protein [Tanacetum cinerariifolium]GEX97569.1 hypothetical protein [Tanacetum cinerariifolium]
MPPKPDLVFNTVPTAIETDHLAFNVQISPPKPEQDLHSVQPIETTFQAATSVPASPKSNSTGKRRNRKACFVCKSVDHLIKDCDYHSKIMAQPTPRNYAYKGHHKQYAPLTHLKPQKHRVPTTALTQSKPVSNTNVRPLSAALPNIIVTRPRNAHQVASVVSDVQESNHPIYVHGNPQQALKDKGVIDSGCSRHMKGNKSYLSDFEELNEGYVAFGGNPKGGKITGKGKIKTGKLDFDDVYFVKELKFNLFSLPDESQVLLRVPRENNMYNVNLKNIVPSGDLTYLFAKATLDESNLWHRRLAYASNTEPLVRPSLSALLTTPFHASYGPTFVKSLNKKSYCLVITDDYSRFTWVFFLANKVETTPILKTFLTGLENQLSLKVKVIRSDNGTEFKNSNLNQFYRLKGIKREFSVPRIPQQNGIAERKNRTLIEAARTMLADSLQPIPFWAEAVDTACYVQNRVLVTKPHNKTPYELLHGRTPSIGFMRPFGCPVTILNTLDPLGKFQGKVDEGFLVGYSICSKAFSAFNSKNPYYSEDDAFDGKEHDFDVKKLESKVILSPSSSAKSKEQDDKIMKEAKGKNMPGLEDIIYSDDDDVVGAEADFNNLESSILVSPIPTTRIHKDHLVSQIIGDLSLTTQTRNMTRVVKDQGGLLQIFVDLPYEKRAIGTKWVYKNKKDKRGIVIKNKAILIAQGHTQDKAIDYEEVKQKKDGIFISQDKYVAKILRMFGHTEGKTASTPIDTEKPLLKDLDGEDKQTALGKDKSNSLMADNLPKIIWYSTHHITLTKNWIVQKQTALGKDKSNSLMADNLPKIIWYSTHHITLTKNWIVQKQTALGVNTPRSDEDRLKIMELTVFWLPKISNDVTRLQALVDKKKVVITEATIRDALRLDDAEGVDCLPNKEIFAELARMGYEKPSTKLTFYKAFFSSQWKFLIHTILQSLSAKRTSWNEFCSAMASVVICLSTSRKFNFSKYIFQSLVRNVYRSSKFYMYPRVGKGFLRVETPLFEGMLVAGEPTEQGDAAEQSEMSLELLRFTRQQHQEGQLE